MSYGGLGVGEWEYSEVCTHAPSLRKSRENEDKSKDSREIPKVHNHRIDAIAKGSRLDLKRVVSRDTGRCECVCARCNGEARRAIGRHGAS